MLTRAIGARILAALICLGAAVGAPAAEPRFAAAWCDGSRAADDEVHDWQRQESQPTLARRPLLDLKNPLRWLCDTRAAVSDTPTAYVEFALGDRLPGRVVGYTVTSSLAVGMPLLLVAPALEIDLPGQRREQIGVRLDLVRRIVFRPHAGTAAAPGTLLAVDGRRIAFRSLRFNDTGAQALTLEGSVQLAFDELAEIQMPTTPQSDALYCTLALVSPNLSARIVRIETSSGARLTTSLARLQPRAVGGDDPQHWFHLLQPAWSLEALAIAHRQIRLRVFTSPDELPLSWLEPVASRHQGTFSSAWSTVQIDRNVQGGPLRAAGKMFAFGFGVHAQHELDFELPAGARALRTCLALDQIVAGGGSAAGRVVVDGQTAFESPLLVGSARVVDSGLLRLATKGPRRLTLVAESAVRKPSAGADPFDIRDVVDWLEPIVSLDPAGLRRELEQSAPRAVWGNSGWTVDVLANGNWQVVNQFSDVDHAHPAFRALLQIRAPLTLTKRITVGAERSVALLSLGRPAQSFDRVKCEISIDGRRIASEMIPSLGESGEPRPIAVPLAEHAGQEVELAIRIDPQGAAALIDWRGLLLASPETSSAPQR